MCKSTVKEIVEKEILFVIEKTRCNLQDAKLTFESADVMFRGLQQEGDPAQT
jgi:hypothetical protein